jgi:hypothetical protein
MSGRYNLVKEFIIKPVKNLIKGKKTSPTIVGTRPNVGNLKFNKDTMGKLKKITDTYVVKAGKVDPGLKKALRDAGSKSLQGDKILRKNKKDGGRMGLKFGGGANKELSPKQMKIASLAGDKKKIDGPDFKKLQKMKKS